MTRPITRNALIAAAAVALVPGASFAASDTGNADTTYTADDDRDDKDFPWGLLGLLGLAGLLGRKRNEDADIRVDARRDTRP